MATRIQFRRGSASEWTSTNPILAEGELGLELNTGRFKVGIGTTSWNNLDYANSTFATNAGIATFATNAGISTNVIGGIASVTQLNVSGVSTFAGITTHTTSVFGTNLSLSGVATATIFVGALTGTATTTTNIPNLTGDITSVNKATTLATVNSNVGTFGGTTSIPIVTVNAKGLVTGVTTVGTVSANDGLLSLAVSGTGLSGSASFTANQSSSSTFTVTSNATSTNTVSTIVARDGSGNFSAGTITANLTGTASSTTNIPNLTGAITSSNTTTSLGSFTSANLATALTDETGSGSAVFATSPTLVTPVLGSATATSIVVGSGVTLNAGGINVTGIVTATSFSTGASGTGVNITTNTISGPAELIIDPAAVGDNTGAVRIKGDLFVDGTQTVINSSIIELADFNVGIATTVGTNLLLDGAGIGIGSTGIRKTLTWSNSSTALKSSENFDILTGKSYKINGTDVVSSTTLGTGIVNSSLTSVGTLGQLNVSGVSTFSTINFGSTIIVSTSTTTTTTSETSVTSISASTYRSAVFQIQVVQGTSYNMTTINAIHDGVETYMTEYGTINQPTGIATFGTDISAGFLRLLAYPTSVSSTTFRIVTTATQI